MKKDDSIIRNVLLAIIVILSFYNNSLSQCPIETELSFTTQNSLDSFIVSYPNCKVLNIVNVSGEINSLKGLKNIIKIDELNLVKTNLTNLNDLRNLNSLVSLNLKLNNDLYSLSELEKITQLDKLTLIQTKKDAEWNLGKLKSTKNFEFRGTEDAIFTTKIYTDTVLTIDHAFIFYSNILEHSNLFITNNLQIAHSKNIKTFYDIKKQFKFDTLDQLLIAELDSFDCRGNEYMPNINNLNLGYIVNLNIDSIEKKATHYKMFTIGGCDNLSNLNPLTNITSEYFGFGYLPSLKSLDGLNTSKTTFIYINFCKNLTNITALNAIDTFEGYYPLRLINNASLSICNIESICKLISERRPQTVWIENNGPDCKNEHEVEVKCILDLTPVINGEKLYVYPNPTSSNEVFIKGLNAINNKLINITIYGSSGQIISMSVENFENDAILKMPPKAGVYYIKFVFENNIKFVKVIKVE